jgi:hypothetical protein
MHERNIFNGSFFIKGRVCNKDHCSDMTNIHSRENLGKPMEY